MAELPEMAKEMVVALVQTGKIPIDSNPTTQGEWIGEVYKALYNKLKESTARKPV
jgi:hypothetical protein